ncbi:hypothetical protein [Krasilnikovia sp. MM14-A1259]|uniref:hypothetical protein n=1 Tax=Krasilnikovia sp. MM14-A1259 TaxID=3373539 RepID=UPI0038079022
MRGKHQLAQQRRRERAAAAELEQLRAEVAAEAARATAARDAAGQTEAAVRRLAREQAATRPRLRPQEQATARLVARVGPAHTALLAARSELEAAMKALLAVPAATAIEQATQAGVIFRLPEVHRGSSTRYAKAWYRKHTGSDLTTDRPLTMDGWVPDDAGDERSVLARYVLSTAADRSPAAARTWTIPPWLRHPDDREDAAELRTALGATTTDALQPPARNQAQPGLRRDATITLPWRHFPLIPHAADAADLGHWYQRSIASQHWHPDTTPVPFWLPIEHSSAYPQARALPAGIDLRLPFPLVFAAFAAPWQLPPTTDPMPDTLRALLGPMLYARGHAADTTTPTLEQVLFRLQGVGVTDRDLLPTPLEALHHFGGAVEGLLLTADADGRPGDEFAWCLRIDHPWGLPLARITVPARRSRTQWRREVDAIIAGVALSSWHEPRRLPSRAPIPRQAGDSTLDSGVHILDVDATSPRAAGRRTGTGRSPRAHLRCGHFRRYPGRADDPQAPWCWVRPTTVNGTPGIINQVYTLSRTSRRTDRGLATGSST